MNGHKLSSTRQWNRHWQNGEEGGSYIPLIPMHDFTNIRTTALRLYKATAGDGTKYYEINDGDIYNILFLPNYNKIYFNMSSYQNPDYHKFDPLILSCNFEININRRSFKSNTLYNLYQNHPEKFHNVSMSKIKLNFCGVDKDYYMISFNDNTHNPDEYYIDYIWGSANENKIKFNINMVCYDSNYDARLEHFGNLEAVPFHAPDSSGYEAFEYCAFENDFIPSEDITLKFHNRYYDSDIGEYVYLYNYLVLPERVIQGSVTTGMDVNDLFAANGDWKLGTTVLSQRVFDYFYGFNHAQSDFPFRIYNTLYEVYRDLQYTDSQSATDVEIQYNGFIQLCKTRNTGTPFYYTSPTLFYNNEPIINADFYYMDTWATDTDVSRFKMISKDTIV